MIVPPRTRVSREAGIYALEQALNRRGFGVVAGADEAGRGACAGPLVIGAAVLPRGRRGEIEELTDSKLLTAAARERVYQRVVKQALAYQVVIIPPGDIDGRGLHVCNVSGMRRALAGLTVLPEYVLTDGFPVDGLGVPGLAVWKGDQVAACVAAASVLAKVTRDRIMCELDEVHPEYGFGEHKGYCTPEHQEALESNGPCRHHRFSYANVAAVTGRPPGGEGRFGVAIGDRARAATGVGENGAGPIAGVSPRRRRAVAEAAGLIEMMTGRASAT